MVAAIKAENPIQVMEKFTTILTIAALAIAAAWATPAAAGCLQELTQLEARLRGDQDWLRRETTLAMIVEARRDAVRGREAACITTLNQARSQLPGKRG